MDEQANPAVEPATTAPEPIPRTAGEANTDIPVPEPATAPVEPPQAEPAEVPTEAISVTETAQNEPISEPIQASPEIQTAQMAGNEPLPEEVPPQAPRPTQQGTTQPEALPPASPLPAQTQTVSSAQTAPSIVRLLFEKAKLTIQLRKQKKFLKIMELVTKKGKITNDDVEKLLRVSDATATRYLSELERQGKISQTGRTGRAVTYTKR